MENMIGFYIVQSSEEDFERLSPLQYLSSADFRLLSTYLDKISKYWCRYQIIRADDTRAMMGDNVAGALLRAMHEEESKRMKTLALEKEVQRAKQEKSERKLYEKLKQKYG